MNQLQPIEQKLVPFGNVELLAVKMSDGKIYAAVKWVCQGVGLTRGQTNNEYSRVQGDLVLKQGARNLVLPTNGGLQEVLCIELDFLPLWLAKISLTPKMQQEAPWTVNNLVTFQLEAKDVLAAAFLQKPKSQLEIMQLQIEQMIRQEKEIQALKETTLRLEEEHENIVSILSLSNNDWRNKVNQIINAIAMKLGGMQYYKDIRTESYIMLEERAACSLDRRLNNRKSKMALKGMSNSAISKVNKLDVIAEDKKLVSVYITVIKDLAVKYQLNISKYNLQAPVLEDVN